MRQIRFRVTRPGLRSPIRSGSAGLAVVAAAVAQCTLQVLAPVAAHSPACFPSAGAAVAVVAVRADMCSDPVPRCDGQVVGAAEGVVDDRDTHSAAAATWGIVQVCSDSTRSRHLKGQVVQEQGDLCWHAH